MARRVLFVIRGKLGDTLVAYATVRSYADAYPNDEIVLMTRANYAALFAAERNLRVVGFSNRAEMFLLLLKLRFEPAFDALLVLWAFGTPVQWIGRLIRARRKVYLDGRYATLFPEYADLSPTRLQSEPMWRVAELFEPALPQPLRLTVPSLANRRKSHPADIGVAPLADEARRIMSASTLANLLRMIRIRHSSALVKVFINPTDRGAADLIAAGLPEGVVFHFFPELEDLLRGFENLAHIYCTDTGLYHLAASMGIPATVFYGPTQPWRNMMPGQAESIGVRLTVLGAEHCEEKACTSPVCIDASVRAFTQAPPAPSFNGAPGGCPLRAHSVQTLSDISRHENTRNQA